MRRMQRSSSIRRHVLAALAFLAIALTRPALGASVRWTFDEAQTGEAMTRAWDETLNEKHLQLRKGTTACDLHGALGSGPSGQPGDRAMSANLYSAPGTTNGYNASGLWTNPQSDAAWQDLSALTITCWVKASSQPGSSCRVMNWGGAESVELWFPWTAGVPGLKVGGVEHRASGTLIAPADVNQWIFLAVTYKGGIASGGVQFYRGTTTSAAAAMAMAGAGDTTGTGNIQNTGAGDLLIGNTASLNRNFPGMVDDFRIYDSALSPTNIEAIRKQGLDPTQRLTDPGFEMRDTPANVTTLGWWHVSTAAYTYAYETAPANVHGGSSSQKITVNLGSDFHIFKRDFKLKAGQTYEGRIWAKATDAAPVRVNFYLRQGGPPYKVFAIRTVTLTGTWQELAFKGGSPTDISVYFGVNILDSGTLWLDDASLKEIPEATGVREIVTRGVVPDTLFGIHLNKLGSHSVWPAMGQKTLRLWDSGTRWGDMELTNNAWNGSRLDYYIRHAYLNGATNILYTLGQPPGWAVPAGSHTFVSNGHTLSTAAPTSTAEWQDYIGWVHNRAPSDVPAGRIRYWELWNEVDVTGAAPFYTGSVSQMVTLAAAAKSKLQSLNAANKLLSPNITPGGLQWLERYLEADGGGYTDIYSIHTYLDTQRPEDFRTFYAAVRDIINRTSGEYGKPIWNTEGAPRAGTTPAMGAGIASRAFISQWIYGNSNYNWYCWDILWNPNTDLTTSASNYSNAALTSAGVAVRETIEWLEGANVVARTITESPTGGEIFVVETTRGTKKGWIVWDTEAHTPRTWSIPAGWGATVLKRLDGTQSSIAGATTLSISNSPVLLEKP